MGSARRDSRFFAAGRLQDSGAVASRNLSTNRAGDGWSDGVTLFFFSELARHLDSSIPIFLLQTGSSVVTPAKPTVCAVFLLLLTRTCFGTITRNTKVINTKFHYIKVINT